MKDDRVYLAHICDAIARILKYTSEGKVHFDQDEKTQDAVVRNLEVIGEAVKNVSNELRKKRETSLGDASPACAISLSMNTSA